MINPPKKHPNTRARAQVLVCARNVIRFPANKNVWARAQTSARANAKARKQWADTCQSSLARTIERMHVTDGELIRLMSTRHEGHVYTDVMDCSFYILVN